MFLCVLHGWFCTILHDLTIFLASVWFIQTSTEAVTSTPEPTTGAPTTTTVSMFLCVLHGWFCTILHYLTIFLASVWFIQTSTEAVTSTPEPTTGAPTTTTVRLILWNILLCNFPMSSYPPFWMDLHPFSRLHIICYSQPQQRQPQQLPVPMPIFRVSLYCWCCDWCGRFWIANHNFVSHFSLLLMHQALSQFTTLSVPRWG